MHETAAKHKNYVYEPERWATTRPPDHSVVWMQEARYSSSAYYAAVAVSECVCFGHFIAVNQSILNVIFMITISVQVWRDVIR